MCMYMYVYAYIYICKICVYIYMYIQICVLIFDSNSRFWPTMHKISTQQVRLRTCVAPHVRQAGAVRCTVGSIVKMCCAARCIPASVA